MDKKKIGIIIGIILLTALLIASVFITPKGDSNMSSSDSKSVYDRALAESAVVKAEERRPYTDIDVNTYLDKYFEEDKSIILLGRDSCHYCQTAEPILQKISKDFNLEIFYLNTDTFTEQDVNDFISSNEVFQNEFGTPFLFIVHQGKIVDKIDGLVDTTSYIDFLKTNGMIEE